MPSEEPRKDRIAEAIVTALEGVSTGADYYTDLGQNVRRRRVNLQELDTTSLPVASVWTGDAAPSPVMCTGSYRERVTVLVEVFVRSERPEDLDRDTIRAEADVKSAVLASTALGLSGVVTQTIPAAVAADHQEFADKNIGRRLIGFDVDYNWTADTP